MTFISHSFGGWKFKINVLADQVPGEDPLSDLQLAIFLLCPHTAEEEGNRG